MVWRPLFGTKRPRVLTEGAWKASRQRHRRYRLGKTFNNPLTQEEPRMEMQSFSCFGAKRCGCGGERWTGTPPTVAPLVKAAPKLCSTAWGAFLLGSDAHGPVRTVPVGFLSLLRRGLCVSQDEWKGVNVLIPPVTYRTANHVFSREEIL